MRSIDNLPVARITGGVVIVYVLYRCAKALATSISWRSALVTRDLPGPKNESLFWGNVQRIFKAGTEIGVTEEAWEAEYGHAFVYRTLFSVRFLSPPLWNACLIQVDWVTRQTCVVSTTDPRAASYVLTHTSDFPKPFDSKKNVETTGLVAILQRGEYPGRIGRHLALIPHLWTQVSCSLEVTHSSRNFHLTDTTLSVKFRGRTQATGTPMFHTSSYHHLTELSHAHRERSW
jgi:hypothetical protein